MDGGYSQEYRPDRGPRHVLGSNSCRCEECYTVRAARVRAAAAQGLSRREAAERLGLHYDVVCTIARRYADVTFRARSPRRLPEGLSTASLTDLLREMAARGLTCSEAAREAGVSFDRVRRCAKHAGIRMRRQGGGRWPSAPGGDDMTPAQQDDFKVLTRNGGYSAVEARAMVLRPKVLVRCAPRTGGAV